MIIGLILGWIVLLTLAVLLLLVDLSIVSGTFVLSRFIKSPALRYLIRAIVVSVVFVPTLIPYNWEPVWSVKSIADFIPTLGFQGAPVITRAKLASYVFLKGFFTGNSSWVHAGGVPLFLSVATIWCTSIALKYLWPILTFCAGAYACLYGSIWYREASYQVYKTNMDPFVIAMAVWTGGILLGGGAIVQTIVWLVRRFSATPTPEQACPPKLDSH